MIEQENGREGEERGGKKRKIGSIQIRMEEEMVNGKETMIGETGNKKMNLIKPVLEELHLD